MMNNDLLRAIDKSKKITPKAFGGVQCSILKN